MKNMTHSPPSHCYNDTVPPLPSSSRTHAPYKVYPPVQHHSPNTKPRFPHVLYDTPDREPILAGLEGGGRERERARAREREESTSTKESHGITQEKVVAVGHLQRSSTFHLIIALLLLIFLFFLPSSHILVLQVDAHRIMLEEAYHYIHATEIGS